MSWCYSTQADLQFADSEAHCNNNSMSAVCKTTKKSFFSVSKSDYVIYVYFYIL